MECKEGIEWRHTQQQHSVPGHAERGKEEEFTSICGAEDPGMSHSDERYRKHVYDQHLC